MKISLVIVLLALLAAPAMAQEPGVIYQTYPGTTFPNYAKPAMRNEGGTVYSTYPGTTAADLSKPRYASPPSSQGSEEGRAGRQIERDIMMRR